MFRTVSIKINPEREPYLRLMALSAEIFNTHVDWCLKNKSKNKIKAHQALYRPLREKYPEVPTALLQANRDNAIEAVKATKFKRTPRKSPFSGIRYDKRTVALRGPQMTLSGIGKRHKEILQVPEYFTEVFETWDFRSANLVYRKAEKQFYIKLVFESESPTFSTGKVIGIDRGIYNLVTSSDGVNYSGSKLRKSQRKYLYNRRTLQAKGTPSAKRRFKRMAGREKRFSRDTNHCLSKRLANSNARIFVLEDLKSIRHKRRGKKINKWISSWPFYQLEFFLQYKAEKLGKKIEFVDSRFTSQRCSGCGNRSRHNRIKSQFKCSHCGFKCHADINAAINIKENYLLSLAEKNREQGAVNHPTMQNASGFASLPARPVGG